MGKEKLRKQHAGDKVIADKLIADATELVDSVMVQLENATKIAEPLIAPDSPKAANPLRATLEAEQALEEAKAAAANALEKVGKTDYEQVKSASSGPLADARRVLLRHKVKLSPAEHRI